MWMGAHTTTTQPQQPQTVCGRSKPNRPYRTKRIYHLGRLSSSQAFWAAVAPPQQQLDSREKKR